jgi:hypothetical protein
LHIAPLRFTVFDHGGFERMRGLHPAVGGLLFIAGLVVFVVGIIDATAGAPSGSVSVQGADTPWLIFAGVGCSIVGGVLFSVAISSRQRQRSYAAAEMFRPPAPASFAPPQAARPVPGGTARDPLEQLERLAALRDAGTLTQAEFDAEKARILGGS